MLDPHEPLFILGALFVAIAYSAVGHGGASGYLALMAFTPMATKDASTLALAMNVGVSLVAFVLFKRSKHFSWRLAWPSLVSSVPLAFLGGTLHMPGFLHKILLAIVLLYAAIVLFVRPPNSSEERREPKLWMQIGIGAGIGLLSGIVGVGGGIFLSPLLLFLGWADAKQTAAVSALFIFCNSLAGLAARSNTLEKTVLEHGPVLLVAVIGAIAGGWIGANRLPDLSVRRVLGVVLLVATIKLLIR